jgi:hypothetical protein
MGAQPVTATEARVRRRARGWCLSCYTRRYTICGRGPNPKPILTRAKQLDHQERGIGLAVWRPYGLAC